MKSRSLIIVDNFYPDPLARREEALSCEYVPKAARDYAGINSVQRFHLEESLQKISAILGEPTLWNGALATGQYRISLASDGGTIDIHADAGDFEEIVRPFPQWNGICYLTLPEDCQGGTSFWRHKKTRLQRYPTLRQQAHVSRTAGVPNRPEEIRKYIVREGLDRSRWTEIYRVPMVFNRLVLFKSVLFHSYTCTFGTTRENGRLVQLFFFDEKKYALKNLTLCLKQTYLRPVMVGGLGRIRRSGC